MATGGNSGESSSSGASNFESRMIASISTLATTFDAKLSRFKNELLEEQKAENERMTKKLKLEKKFEFRKKGNEIQHAFNENVKAKVEEAAAIVEKLQGTAGAVEKAKESLKEGVQLIEERQKLIKIADQSDSGWLTAQEYEADDSDDEKRIARAERQAEKLKKKRGQNSVRRGRGGSFFRGQQYRQEAPRYFDRSNGWQAQRVAWSAPQPTVRATSNLVCFMCGRTGHIRRECPLQKLGVELEQPAVLDLLRESDSSCEISAHWWDPIQYILFHGISGYSCIDIDYIPVTPGGMQDGIDFTSVTEDSGLVDCNETRPLTLNPPVYVSVQGRLASCYQFWKDTLLAPEAILSIISKGYVLPLKEQPPTKLFKNHANCIRHEHFIDDSIEELVVGNCVKIVDTTPYVCNPLSVVCNRSGKCRLVLDLRYVNRYLWKCKFKYEDLRTVLSMFNRGDYVITFDLKSGYHHVDVNEEQWKYLGFCWKGQYYVFKVLPFGLSTACYVFTKLLRPLVRYWRSQGIRVVLYIDDGIIAFPSLEVASDAVEGIIQDIRKAGLTVNEKKSRFVPSQRCVWLGFILDFKEGKIFVEQDKLDVLTDDIDRILSLYPMVKVREVASLVGRILSMARAVGSLARMFTRSLYAAIGSRMSWYAVVCLDARAKAEMEFWKANVHRLNGHAMWFASSAVRVAYSDASGIGFGGYAVEHADKVVHGSWTVSEQSRSSTWRELVAVRRVLWEIAPLLVGYCVKWNTDNQNVVRILLAGSRKDDLQDQAVTIYSICAEHSVRLEPVWVPRDENVYADYVSKLAELDDWSLNPQVFQWLDDIWGPHTVDRFANNVNAQLNRFNSRFWSIGTEAVDAFTCDWSVDNNWICPPPLLIPRILRHMQNCKAVGTMVVPEWKSAPFWPILCPEGCGFAPFVTAWLMLPNEPFTFLPGVQRQSAFGSEPLVFPVFALRVSFQ